MTTLCGLSQLQTQHLSMDFLQDVHLSKLFSSAHLPVYMIINAFRRWSPIFQHSLKFVQRNSSSSFSYFLPLFSRTSTGLTQVSTLTVEISQSITIYWISLLKNGQHKSTIHNTLMNVLRCHVHTSSQIKEIFHMHSQCSLVCMVVSSLFFVWSHRL